MKIKSLVNVLDVKEGGTYTAVDFALNKDTEFQWVKVIDEIGDTFTLINNPTFGEFEFEVYEEIK